MTEPIHVLFISISGNTRAFAHRLAVYAQTQHDQNAANPTIVLKEISDATQSDGETKPFFVMVAMDENEHPMQVPGLKICTEAEKGRHEAGLLRKNMRKNRMKTGF